MNAVRNFFILFSFLFINVALASEKESASPYAFQGVHFLASYNGCDEAALTNLKQLSSVMLEAARASGATILDSAEYVFPPDGLTMVLLLSESHASIHTYPEHQACFIDLFTCGTKCSSERFDKVLRDYLKPKDVQARLLVRNQSIAEKS